MPTPEKQRGRACEACSRLKIKCELGSSIEALPPCERCNRLGKECTLVPRVRQKDRVADLESQVAALTRLLEAQGIRGVNDEIVTPESLSATASPSDNRPPFSKKRRLSQEAPSPSKNSLRLSGDAVESPSADRELLLLDELIPHDLQHQIHIKYMSQMLPIFPLVPPTGDCSLDDMRTHRPMLLKAIIYAASPGILSLDQQDQISYDLFAEIDRATTTGKKTLELVQAIQVACLWFRSPRRHTHVTAFELAHMALKLAMGLRPAGTPSEAPFAPPIKAEEPVDSADACRIWLVCYVLSSGMAVLTRRSSLLAWTPQHESSLFFLDYSPTSDFDRWCGQYIRGEHLCQQIASRMGLCDLHSTIQASELDTIAKIPQCRDQITNFKMMIPKALRRPEIMFLEHVATAYLHEYVLHTPTNKASFAAPFIAERLSMTDVPCPVLTEDHIASLFELQSALHAIIDIFSGIDTTILAAYPGLLLASRVAYALYVLAKLYIATSAPSSSFGLVLPPETVQLQKYIGKVVGTAERLDVIDERSGTSRILRSAHRVQEWYDNYSTSVDLAATPLLPDPLPSVQPTNQAWVSDIDGALEWESLFSETHGGLDDLFAQPITYENVLQ